MSEYKLLEHINANGLLVDRLEYGELIRCATEDKPRKKNGWYIAYSDLITGVGSIVWGNWATGQGGKYTTASNQINEQEKKRVDIYFERIKAIAKTKKANEWARNEQVIKRIMNQCVSIKGTIAQRYLNGRGIEMIPDTDALLYHPRLPYNEQGRVYELPALIGVFTDHTGKNVITLQRIYLNEKGEKASVETPKKVMSVCGEMAGGSVKIGVPIHSKEHGDVIGIAEGIETALSAWQLFKVPTWATLGTSTLKKFEPPSHVGGVVIFADNDDNGAGNHASKVLGKRLAEIGIFAISKIPAFSGDWNDIIQKSLVGGEL